MGYAPTWTRVTYTIQTVGIHTPLLQFGAILYINFHATGKLRPSCSAKRSTRVGNGVRGRHKLVPIVTPSDLYLLTAPDRAPGGRGASITEVGLLVIHFQAFQAPI